MTAKAENHVESFGCRLNAYESQVIRDHLGAAGRERVVVVNTCAVTSEAERQARQAIRRARRTHPEAEIVVTGCAAQIDPDRFAAMPEVAQVLGNVEKLDPKSWAPEADGAVLVGDIMAVTETAGHLIDGFGERARAYRVEAKGSGTWQEVATGSCIGHKHIQPIDPIHCEALRWTCLESADRPHIRRFAALGE